MGGVDPELDLFWKAACLPMGRDHKVGKEIRASFSTWHIDEFVDVNPKSEVLKRKLEGGKGGKVGEKIRVMDGTFFWSCYFHE